MKNILFIFLLLPATLVAQEDNTPYVKFDQEAILFYLPSESTYPLLLPASKPGFVHILRTPGIQTQTNREISDNLASGIRHLISEPMTPAQKTEFLEQYACLILLNYNRVSALDTVFYTQAVSLQDDLDQEIKKNALLVVQMVDLYKEE